MFIKKRIYISLLIFGLIFISFKSEPYQISLSLNTSTLHKGKKIVMKSDVYFKYSNNLLITYFSQPIEQITIANNTGEFKQYDPQKNEIRLMQGKGFSSEESIFYSFLKLGMHDMGLSKAKYIMKDSKYENGSLIQLWNSDPNFHNKPIYAKLVFEDNLPIFFAYFKADNTPVYKTYYSNYNWIGNSKFPFKIVEIDYKDNGDSIVVKKDFGNLKLNEDVNSTYINYKVPVNAKVVK